MEENEPKAQVEPTVSKISGSLCCKAGGTAVAKIAPPVIEMEALVASSSPFRALSAQIDLPAMENEILSFWQTQEIFHKSVAQRADGDSWTFYEGPPTANEIGRAHV